MKKSKDKFLMILRFAGIIIVIIGAFVGEWLADDKKYISLTLIVIGIVTNFAATFPTKTVYLCPMCKTQFDMPKGEIVLTTGGYRNRLKSALLTCPNCQRTNWCIGTRVAKVKEKKYD